MINRSRIVGLLFSCLLLSWFIVMTRGANSSQPVKAGSNPPPNREVAKGDRALGVASCAASNCHGNANHVFSPSFDEQAAPRPDDCWKSSYLQWASYDRHADAYKVLENERSQRIMRNWKHVATSATQETTCLACHVNPAIAAKFDSASKELHGEGVSCEACHGNAERWRFEHAGWSKATNRDDAYDQTGMAKLFQPGVRADVCVGCHVGAPASGNIPLREVNHDLIAAGHPRLNFEFTTYLRKMPAHWSEKDRQTGKARDPGYEAKFWAVGQRAVGDATLRLLKEEATSTAPDFAQRWPELSNFNCYACHHDLRLDSGRGEAAKAGRTFGGLVWNRPGIGALSQTNKPLNDALEKVEKLLLAPAAVRHEKLPGAITEAQNLWDEAFSNAQSEPGVLFRNLANSKSDWTGIDWDEAARIFAAAVAIENGKRDQLRREAMKGDVEDPKMEKALSELYRVLRLPREKKQYFDSPHDIEPEQIRKAVQNWLDLIGSKSETPKSR